MSLSVCCLTAAPFEQTAEVLRPLRPVADEMVVAVDARVTWTPEVLDFADKLLRVPFAPPLERSLGWLHAQCSGDWVLRLDSDELASPALLAALPELITTRRVTQFWLLRRWLFPDPDRTLTTWPWHPDHQLRLVRNDPALLRFPAGIHDSVRCLGAAEYLDQPLYHADLLLASAEQRAAKVDAYERAGPGRRIAGRPMNAAFYLPELASDPATQPVPPDHRPAIKRLLAAARGGPDGRTVSEAPPPAARGEVDRHWGGRLLAETAYRGAIEVLARSLVMVAGEQRTIELRVRNLGEEWWPWGEDARPAIRVAYRWLDADGGVVESEGLRTPLPRDVPPGEAVRLPAHVVAPASAGPHRLAFDLLHEHERWFGRESSVEVAIRPRRRVAVIGGYSPFRHVGDDAIVEAHVRALAGELPDREPMLFGENPATLTERFGTSAAPSVHAYLMAGTEQRTRGVAFLGRVVPRAVRLLLAARARATGRSAAVPAPAAAFLDALASCEALLAATAGSLTSEFRRAGLWPHAVTLLTARALGVRVLVSGVTVGPLYGPADRLLMAAAMRAPELIAVRDRGLSVEALTGLRVPRDRVVEAPDPATALAPAPAEEIDAALARAGLAPGDPFVALSLHEGAHLDLALKPLAHAIERLHTDHGLPALFVPMVVHGEHDDRAAAAALARRLERPEAMRTLEPLPANDVISGVIGRARVAVGSRYHLAVFAAAHGVPSVGVYAGEYYRLKLEGLARLAAGQLVTALELPGQGTELLAAVEAALRQRAHDRPARPGLPAVKALRDQTPVAAG